MNAHILSRLASGYFVLALARFAHGGDLDCLSELTVPRYPELARQGHMSGEVKASIDIDGTGRVHAVSAETTKTLLQWTVKRALDEATISVACRNTTVHLTFIFELTHDVKPEDPGVVVFRSPATFVIRASLAPINESGSRK